MLARDLTFFTQLSPDRGPTPSLTRLKAVQIKNIRVKMPPLRCTFCMLLLNAVFQQQGWALVRLSSGPVGNSYNWQMARNCSTTVCVLTHRASSTEVKQAMPHLKPEPA